MYDSINEMDTAYNRRISSTVDAINHRAARHAPANFVGRGYGSESGIDTQYRDVMGAAYNHPRDLSRAEKEMRAEGGIKEFGGNLFDDIGQAFRYTPIGMISDAAQGRQNVLAENFSGRGYSGLSGGSSATEVGVTMPFREAGNPGVEDFADPLSGKGRPGMSGGKPKFPLATTVQVGNMDGSGEPPKVGCAWFASLEDFKGGRNRMMESKKIGRMTKMPDIPSDLTEDEMRFVEDLFKRSKGGAGYYGGAWYNDWGDFVEAVSDAYDTVKGVWEDYIKPVLDVVGEPLKEALISSGNPYGVAAGGVLELLGYGYGGRGDGIGGDSGGNMSVGVGRPGMSGGRGDGIGGEMYAIPGMKWNNSGGRSGGADVGVFANAKPIPANSLGFDPKLEVSQLNAATGSTSYGDMPTSNPVGSGMSVSGGRKRRLIKNARGAAPAPTKMGEGELTGGALQDIMAAVLNGIISGAAAVPDAVATAARALKKAYKREDVQVVLTYLKEHPDVLIPFLPGGMAASAVIGRLLQTYLNMPTKEEEWEMVDEALDAAPVVDMDGAARKGKGKLKITHGGTDVKDVLDAWTTGLMLPLRGKKGGGFMEDLEKMARDVKEPEMVLFDDKVKGKGKLKITHGGKKVCSSDGKYCVGMDDYEDPKMKELLGMGRGGSKMERKGLEVSGDNSMGAIVAERGFSKKSQKQAAAVEEKAKDNIWDGEKFESQRGRSGKKINSLILQDATRGQKGVSVAGGSSALSGGVHPLTQVNNLKGVFGGGAEKSAMTRKGQSNAYSQLTKKIMAEKGMRLGEASAYIKANGLYKK